MPTRLRLLALLLPLASGCALAIGGTAAHPRAVWEDDATVEKWKPVGGGWYELVGVERVPLVGSFGLGVLGGQKYMRLSGGLTDREATPGVGAERHVDVTVALWRIGLTGTWGKFDQWVDYAGGFRMAWMGTLYGPRVSFAPLSWASLYGGYSWMKGDELTLGYNEGLGWAQTAFHGSGRDLYGSAPTGDGTQAYAGVDVTVFRYGRGKLGVKVEAQRTRSDVLAVPGAPGARFETTGFSTELYLGTF